MEQPVIPGQDPVQPQAPAPAQAEPATPAPPQTYQSDAPWGQDLSQAFSDPQIAADVDAFLKRTVQPRVTQLEQQYAETEQARQLYQAYEADPEAANIAVNRTLYGDDYADQLAASLNRADLMAGPAAQAAQQQYQQQVRPQPQPAAAPTPAVPPEYQEMYQEWSNNKQQTAYDEAKAAFLADPQYADVNPKLFDPFVAGAETWEQAVGSYRAYAANFAQNGNSNEQPPQPPPTLGSDAVGAPGSTPTYPDENLDEAIDGMFSENKPGAPPTLGAQ